MMGAMTRKIRCRGKPMTAIVLAGGRGRRMKADKAGLDIGGRTLLEHVIGQLEPYFDEILICLSPGQKVAPLLSGRVSRRRRPGSSLRDATPPLRIVRDETPGLGPLGGLISGLKAAAHDACAVVACDIPDIDIALLRSLAREAVNVEIAVPAGPSGLYEPLFAVYRGSIVPEIESLLGRGERSILPLFASCRTAVVGFDDPGRIRNLNTRRDYEAYLSSSLEGKLVGPGAGRGGGGRRRQAARRG